MEATRLVHDKVTAGFFSLLFLSQYHLLVHSLGSYQALLFFGARKGVWIVVPTQTFSHSPAHSGMKETIRRVTMRKLMSWEKDNSRSERKGGGGRKERNYANVINHCLLQADWYLTSLRATAKLHDKHFLPCFLLMMLYGMEYPWKVLFHGTLGRRKGGRVQCEKLVAWKHCPAH